MPIPTPALRPVYLAFSMASSSDNFRTDIQFVRVLLDCRFLAAFRMHYTCYSQHWSHLYCLSYVPVTESYTMFNI